MFHVKQPPPCGRGGVARILVWTVRSCAAPGAPDIWYLHPLLAFLVGIVHAAFAPVIVLGGVKPNLVLIAVVLVTILIGFLPGITWAFVAGLAANLLVGAPLGSIPLTMLIVAAIAAGGARALGRLTWIYPIAAVLVGSIVADALTLLLGQLVADTPLSGGIPAETVVTAAVLNAAIAAILLAPARLLVARYAADEAPAW
jgi:rod shape-determining protein MreD